jgi:hypothetical protein
MGKGWRRILRIAVVVTGAAFQGHGGQSGQADDILTRHVGEVQTENVEVNNVLASGLRTARVPGGIVRAPHGNEMVKQLKPAGAKLSDLLAAIVASVPTYRWDVDNGVVNLVPTTGAPPLLTLRIRRFDVPNATSAADVVPRLLNLPSVKKRAAELNLNSGLQILVGGGRPRPKKVPRPFRVHVQDCTLLEALNTIVRAQGHGVWEYKETHWQDHHGFEVNLIVD